MHDPVSTLKRSALVLMLAAAVFASGAAGAQNIVWNPRSGDVWVDNWLGDMNRYGARYPEPFVDEMVRYHDVPRPLVLDLLQTRRWAPGDVYFACALASTLGRPCRYVVDYYDANRGQGWGVIAQRLGIKPGSAEFHRLKKGFVPTYDRWARPIDLDDDLRRDFPNRGKGHGAASHGKASGKSGASGKRGASKSSKSARGPATGKDKSGEHGPGAQGGKDGKKGKSKGHGKG